MYDERLNAINSLSDQPAVRSEVWVLRSTEVLHRTDPCVPCVVAIKRDNLIWFVTRDRYIPFHDIILLERDRNFAYGREKPSARLVPRDRCSNREIVSFRLARSTVKL